MNILHISASDSSGGSGKSAYKIHSGLRELGAQSHMLVAQKNTGDKDVELLEGSQGKAYLNRLIAMPFEMLGFQYFFHPSSTYLYFNKLYKNADIIQLYNTHGGYFSHLSLTLLGKNKPIVWRLSDMWPFTGHCAYSYDCMKWKSGCGKCPYLKEYPSLNIDTTHLLLNTKKRIYKKIKLDIVAPSKWIKGCAEASPLFSGSRIHLIPNGIDINIFRPIKKEVAREALNLPNDKTILMFSAASLNDTRKGAEFLNIALKKLKANSHKDVAILLVGGGKLLNLDYPMFSLGDVSNDYLMALAYSAADIFILPTLAENLPNSILESMGCGTPVVAFDIGGVSDAVRNMETGYLAKLRDSDDLFKCINLLIENTDKRIEMGASARIVVENEYTTTLQARRFLELYKDISKNMLTKNAEF